MAETTSRNAPAAPTRTRSSLIARLTATACGLGYLPKAPGTWGSLAGVFIYWLCIRNTTPFRGVIQRHSGVFYVVPVIELIGTLAVAISILGLWSAEILVRETGQADPQIVVVDEVSGQLWAYILAATPANWKYLLLGFILFRAFDIWKPFPARQAESLPGGWGIMADDWVAGIYAALGLWIARMLGL
jgi:phosphatidylglycerophosphatase A